MIANTQFNNEPLL